MNKQNVVLCLVSVILLISTVGPVGSYPLDEDTEGIEEKMIEHEGLEEEDDRLTIESLFDRGEQLEDDHPYDMDTIKDMTLEDLNWTNQAIDKAPDWNMTYEDPETGENKSLRVIEGTFGGEDMLGNNSYQMYPKEQMQSGNLTDPEKVNLKHGGIFVLPHDHENASGIGNGLFMHTHSLPSISDDFLTQQLIISVTTRFEVPVFLMGEFSQNWETFNFTSEDDIIYPSLLPGMIKNNASAEVLKMFYGYALVRGNLLGHSVFENLNHEFGLHLDDGILSEGGSKQGHARYFAAMLDDRIKVAQADLLMLQDKINATQQYYRDWGRPPIQNHTGWANYSNQIASITTAIGDSWVCGLEDPDSPYHDIYEVWDIHNQAHLLKDVPLLSISGTLGVGGYEDGEYVTDHDGTYFPLGAESNFLDRLDELGVEWRYGKEKSTLGPPSGYPIWENRIYSNALNGLSFIVEENDTLADWPEVSDVETTVEGHNSTHDWFNVTAQVENPQENTTVKLRYAGNSDRRWNDPEHAPDGEHTWTYSNMTEVENEEEDDEGIYEVSIKLRSDLMHGYYVEASTPGVELHLLGELMQIDRFDISPVRFLNEYEPVASGVTDLFVDDHQITPEKPSPGEEVELTLDVIADRPTIWLEGAYDSLPPLRNIDVELKVDGEKADVRTISITEEKEIEFSWTAESYEENVKVTVDSGNVVPDYNEDNTTYEFTTERPEPFFGVEIIDHDDEVVKGDEVVVEYNVTNTGELEGNQTIEFTVDEELKKSEEVTLGKGDAWEDEFVWQAEEAGNYLLAVSSENDDAEAAVTVLEEYELNIEAEEGGTTDPEPGNHTHVEGEEVTVKAIPDEGWYFEEWTGDHDGTEEEITITMDDDKEITAHFEEIEYHELTVDIEGEGKVEVEPDQEEYEEGTEVDLTAVPDEHWYFVDWSGDYEGTDEDITINMDDDKKVTAHFEPVQHELTINVEGEGTTDPEEGSHSYEHGTEVTVTAEPDDGWKFVQWTGYYESEEEEINITMDEDKDITAEFEEEEVETYDLTIKTEGEGSTDPEEGTHSYEEGTEVNVTATADERWYFVNWSGDHTGQDDEITITMDDDKEITAHFEIHEYDLRINIDGQGTTDPEEGTHSYEHGEEITITATPSEDWDFDQWTGDYESEEDEITIEMDEDKDITAVFEEEVKIYDLTIDIEGEGSTDPEEGTHSYEEGTEVNVTATAAEGWYFVNWSGDYTGQDENITITIDEDIEMTARFEEGEVFFQVKITDYDEDIEEGEEVRIEYLIQNTGQFEGTQDIVLVIGGEEKIVEEDLTLEPEELHTGEFTWTIETFGEHQILLRGDDTEDLVEVTVVEEERPGFVADNIWVVLILLMIIGAVIVFMILTAEGKKESPDEESEVKEAEEEVEVEEEEEETEERKEE